MLFVDWAGVALGEPVADVEWVVLGSGMGCFVVFLARR